jgi:hypothetical protein
VKSQKVWLDMGPNVLLEGEGFEISYNPGNYFGLSSFSRDTGGAETALMKDGKYFILNGDYRKDYEELVDKGFEACIKFYLAQHPTKRSSWSNEYSEEGL